MKIYNVPEDQHRRFVVFRLVDGDAWFYGAWDDYKKAMSAALMCGGQIIPADEVET